MKNLIILSLLLLHITAFCKENENNTILIKGITTKTCNVGEHIRLSDVTINNIDKNNSILKTYNSYHTGKFKISKEFHDLSFNNQYTYRIVNEQNKLLAKMAK
jgi:hypothetical protein